MDQVAAHAGYVAWAQRQQWAVATAFIFLGIEDKAWRSEAGRSRFVSGMIARVRGGGRSHRANRRAPHA